ncbi:mobilisation protein (MobC) [Malonomonas rubra DSM 5091]|uniref:Mobilisation protein (MobC) n=1 Tax=Malonomonas rubra DSM 5091 TaxID=1122189 RepID=A0A1M6KU82_MALRU|nr:plasmid mobilization relaxosome protein MobC [Malonomonas rubra]SHJ62521.1 mobilisation protein (MobC) [Malonomonas rubra DSM 5091]
MPIIKAEVDKEQKTAFRNLAKSQGMTETELLRQMINQATDAAVVDSEEKIERNNRTTISFTEQEFNRLIQRSRADGFSKHTAWIVGLVRTVLFRQPSFSTSEIDVLRESNREIAAIGRNLNQIARAINADFRDESRIKRAEIKAIADSFAVHKKQVFRLIDQSLNRWSVDDE